MAPYNPASAWSKGRTKSDHPGLMRIAEARHLKNNFAAWQNAHPVHYEKLERSADLAFLIGLVLGDGNIHAFPRAECLTITLGTDKPALWKYTAKIVEKIFNKKPSVAKVKASACMRVRIYQQRISERLEIPTGNRGHIAIKIPDWINENETFLIAYLKGLFEAEGSFCIHLPTCTYNFCFTNHNSNLLDVVQVSLERLGFHPRHRSVGVSLRKRAEALAFEKLISFRKYPNITTLS